MSERKLVELDLSIDREQFISEDVVQLIRSLPADSKPLWGMMTTQHMIEHLIYIIDNMLGRNPISLLIPVEKLPKYKAFLMGPFGFMQNFKFPLLPKDELPLLKYDSPESAKAAFEKTNEELLEMINAPEYNFSMHPFYGEMNREESIMFHYKHLSHHMMQFGLIPIPG